MNLLQPTFTTAVLLAIAVPAVLAVCWTLLATAMLLRLPLGSKRPAWVSLHPLGFAHNPKSSEHTARPSPADVAVALLASLLALPLLLVVAAAWLRYSPSRPNDTA